MIKRDANMKIIILRRLFMSLLLIYGTNATAASVAIDTMYVDSASAVLDLGLLGTSTASTAIAPPAEINMGTFQSSIFSMSGSGLDLAIYSTDAFGAVAPSGFVDGTTIDVDFSSLRANIMYGGSTYDVELWPLTTSLSYGIYEPVGDIFNIGWTENLSLDLGGLLGSPATLDLSLQGSLTTVPLPAGVWLFGSGLIGLVGIARRRVRV